MVSRQVNLLHKMVSIVNQTNGTIKLQAILFLYDVIVNRVLDVIADFIYTQHYFILIDIVSVIEGYSSKSIYCK